MAIQKARFWWAVLYPENMLEDWVNVIGDKLQIPYAYCYHSSDTDTKSEHRKDHIHLIVCFNNTTTYKHAMSVFDLLSKPGKNALNKCEAIVNIRNCYDYLIHDTETCRKAKKHKYEPFQRITGNNFDIGSFEQVGICEKNAICKELAEVIIEQYFVNFAEFYKYVLLTYEDTVVFEIVKTNSGFFERLCKGNYQNMHIAQKATQE